MASSVPKASQILSYVSLLPQAVGPFDTQESKEYARKMFAHFDKNDKWGNWHKSKDFNQEWRLSQ